MNADLKVRTPKSFQYLLEHCCGNKALEIQPNLAIVYRNRGDARKAKGDRVGAIADYGKVIEIEPQNAEVYFERGVLRQTQTDSDGANQKSSPRSGRQRSCHNRPQQVD